MARAKIRGEREERGQEKKGGDEHTRSNARRALPLSPIDHRQRASSLSRDSSSSDIFESNNNNEMGKEYWSQMLEMFSLVFRKLGGVVEFVS